MRVAAYCGLTFRDFFGNQPALPALRYFCCDHDYISPAGAALFFAPTLRRLRSECACAWYPMGDVLRQLTRSGCACTLRALVLGKAKNKHFYPKVHPEDFVAVATLPKPERLTVFLDSSLEFSDFGEVLPIPPFRPCTSSGSAVATSWRRKVWTSQTEMRRCAASRPCCGISIRCACCSSSPSPSAPAPAPRTRASTSPPRRSGRTARRAPRAASPWACPHPRRSPPLTPRTLSFARGNFDIGLAGPQAIADAWPRLARLYLGHASLLSAARSPTSCAGCPGWPGPAWWYTTTAGLGTAEPPATRRLCGPRPRWWVRAAGS